MENLMALNSTAKDGDHDCSRQSSALPPSLGGGSVAIGTTAWMQEVYPLGHEEQRREQLPGEPMRLSVDLPVARRAQTMRITNQYPSVERRENLSPAGFFSDFVAMNRPVLVPKALSHCRALSRWTDDYLREVAGSRTVMLKQGLNDDGVAGLKTITSRLSDYLDQLTHFETGLQRNEGSAKDRPPYLHDLPLLSVLPEAANDLDGFPSGYFPDWYQADWLKFAQFFLGPSHSLTPYISIACSRTTCSFRSGGANASFYCITINCRSVTAINGAGARWMPRIRTLCVIRSIGKRKSGNVL